MRHVRNVHLQVPPAVRAPLDVHGIIKIPRRLAVYRNNRQMTKIFPPRQVRFLHRQRALLRVFHYRCRKHMRQMMLANNNFRVDAKLARPPQNLDHSASGRGASPRIPHHLNVHHRAIQLFQPWNAPPFQAPLVRAAETQLLRQPRSQLHARRNLDRMLHPRVVRQHRIAARAVAKQSHYGRMRSPKNAQYSPFGALRVSRAADALNFYQHAIPVHRVFDAIARDEHIAIQPLHRRIGHHESVPIVVQHESPRNFVAAGKRAVRRCGSLRARGRACTGPSASRTSSRAVSAGTPATLFLAAGQAIAPSRQLLDSTPLLQRIQHFVQDVSVRPAHVQPCRNIVGRGRFTPNLQKSQDVIGAQV